MHLIGVVLGLAALLLLGQPAAAQDGDPVGATLRISGYYDGVATAPETITLDIDGGECDSVESETVTPFDFYDVRITVRPFATSNESCRYTVSATATGWSAPAVAVDFGSYSGDDVVYVRDIAFALAPVFSNDDLANAMPIDSVPASVPLVSVGATAEVGETGCPGAYGEPSSVWFRLQSDQPGPAFVRNNGSGWITAFVSDVEAPSVGDLAFVACDRELVRLEDSGATTYWVQVSGADGRGYSTLDVLRADGGSVTAEIAAYVDNAAANPDELPAAWRVEVTSADASCLASPRTVELPLPDRSAEPLLPGVEFRMERFMVDGLTLVSPGGAYCRYEFRQLPVDGWAVQTSPERSRPNEDEFVDISWSNHRRPSNDALADAVVLDAGVDEIAGLAAFGTVELGETTCLSDDAFAAQSVWVSFVAETSGFVRFTHTGVGDVLGFFTAPVDAPSVDALELLGCGNTRRDGVPARIDGPVTQGSRYWVQIANDGPTNYRNSFPSQSFSLTRERLDELAPFAVIVRAQGGELASEWVVDVASTNCPEQATTQTVPVLTGLDRVELDLRRFASDGQPCAYQFSAQDEGPWIAPDPQVASFNVAAADEVTLTYRYGPSNDDRINAVPIDLDELPVEIDFDASDATFEGNEFYGICRRRPALSGSLWYKVSGDDGGKSLFISGANVRVYISDDEFGEEGVSQYVCQGGRVSVPTDRTIWIQVLGGWDLTAGTLKVQTLESLVSSDFDIRVTTSADEPLPERYRLIVTSENCLDSEQILDAVSNEDGVVTLRAAGLQIYNTYRTEGTYCQYSLSLVDANERWAPRRVWNDEGGADVELVLRPVNDEPAGAEEIQLAASLGPDVTGATAEGLECLGDAVWYRLDADSDFLVDVDVGTVGVYTATVDAPTADELAEVACISRYGPRAVTKAAGKTFFIGVARTPFQGNESPSVQLTPIADDGKVTVSLQRSFEAILLGEAGLPATISVTVASTRCGVEVEQTVEAVTGDDVVEFTGLPRFGGERGDSCSYDVSIGLPRGWANQTRAIGLAEDTRFTRFTYERAPNNDRIEFAEPLASNYNASLYSRFSPERDEDESVCSSTGVAWYRWTAPVDGQLTVSRYAAIYTSSTDAPMGEADLDLVLCTGYQGGTIAATEGETYWIAVEGSNFPPDKLKFVPTGCLATPSARAVDGQPSGVFTIDARGHAVTANTAPLVSHYSFDPSSSDVVEFCVTVDRPGRYQLWTEMFGPDRESDSFWLVVNDAAVSPAFVAPGESPQWVAPAGEVDRTELYLDHGAHRVRVFMREPGAALAGIDLRAVNTADPNFNVVVPSSPYCGYTQYSVATRVEAEAAVRVGTPAEQLSADGSVRFVGRPAWQPNQYSLVDNDVFDLCFWAEPEAAGRYKLTAQVRAPSESADSFFVQVGDREPFVWHLDEAQDWAEQSVHVPGTSDAFEFDVGGSAPSFVSVRFFVRESGTDIDWIRLDRVD